VCLTWKDYLAARTVYTTSILTFENVQGELHSFEKQKNTTSWLEFIYRKGLIKNDHIRPIYQVVSRFEYMRAESLYGKTARRHGVSHKSVEQARAHQQNENYQRRLGELLLMWEIITPVDHAKILASAREYFLRDTARLTQLARQKLLDLQQRQTRPSTRFFASSTPGQLAQSYGLDKKLFDPAENQEQAGQRSDKALDHSSGSWTRESFWNHGSKAKSSVKPSQTSLEPKPQIPDKGKEGAWEQPRSKGRSGSMKIKTKEQRLEEKLGMTVTPGAWLDQRFEIIERLGKGGMGIVYKARDATNNQQCAIKLAYPQHDKNDDGAKRFEREVLATKLVDHNNVVKVFDSGQLECGIQFMAMEIVPGEELKRKLVRQGALPLTYSLELTEGILLGLKACHDKEVVHRDLKPDNIRVFEHDDQVQIRIMDFGLSRLLNEQIQVNQEIFMTQHTTVSGSPAYMAPESITDAGNVDFRCDLYSVGVCLFEFVTGTLPFPGRTVLEFLDHHLYSSVPGLEQRLPEQRFPDSLEAFIRKLMEKERDLRFQSCAEALQLFEKVKDDCKGWDLRPKKSKKAKKSKVKPVSIIQKIVRFFRRQ
jgi:hypothetical protein